MERQQASWHRGEPVEGIFSKMISGGFWGSPETPCGPGSTLVACEGIIETLPEWFRKYRIKTLLDAGCGDFHWMSRVDLRGITYDGYDVVPDLIRANRKLHVRRGLSFHHGDILTEDLQKSDLILCKDVLIHLPTKMADEALEQIRRSGSRYVAATSHRDWPVERRSGMHIGEFSPLDLEGSPFLLGTPLEEIGLPGKPGNPEKFLGLWRLQS